MPSPRPSASSLSRAEPPQAEDGQNEGDEAVPDAVQRPHGRVGEGRPVGEAHRTDEEDPDQREGAAEQGEGTVRAGQGDGGHDVHHGREGGQQVREWRLVELRRDLYTGPRARREREEPVDTDEYPS